MLRAYGLTSAKGILVLSSLLPIMVSTYGGDIDHLFWLIFWIVGIWFVAAEGILLYSIIRHRKRNGVRAMYLRGDTPRQLAWVSSFLFGVIGSVHPLEGNRSRQ